VSAWPHRCPVCGVRCDREICASCKAALESGEPAVPERAPILLAYLIAAIPWAVLMGIVWGFHK
jgi:hypothetical protein